jgi:hypothetical protein
MLGLERVKQSFVIGPVFAREDQGAGVEAMFQAIPTDGSASSGRFRAGTFLCVSPVSLYLSCSCHKILSLNFRVADGS